jgi:plasmid stability protein
MAGLTLQDIPDDLHGWLQQQAARHHRSPSQEAVALLEKQRSEPL